jgi:hydrogenase nickel incorporation protein HypA/HybF
MHELSIALVIVDMAVEESGRHGGGRISTIHLKVGVLAGVVPAALRSSFELAREQTPLADTELVIEEIPLAAFCTICDAERTLDFPYLCCPNCGTPTTDIVHGRELEVVALEIDTS